ncbi:MAG: tRNA epoxyqueuosine(34) reductase QueG [Magnetovibrio sp.]|nr:tRNA epoxyqueuosine(34) reductase QueG [Magnetovibrio sp.]|tara:strand:+ start:877 stop:2001 length:1125 start_codon:yes stop_codon:yes gene_type:complete
MLPDIRHKIREKAKQVGFDAVGFTKADSNAKDLAAINAFLKKGLHGDMAWMDREFPKYGNPRGNPKALMPNARSVIVFGINYGPRSDPLHMLSHADLGSISVYAQTEKDYHVIIKKRLKSIGRWLINTVPSCKIKIFVDTAPIMEKPLAARAGIGWQGKHTNLVSREFGSWLFLGEILTTLDIPPDTPETDHCGTCDLCIRACPTDAIVEPYRIDARRCISYLTIEHKGSIEPDLMSLMGNRIYGCDDCLSVCPWTKFSRPVSEPELQARSDLNGPKLNQLLRMDDTEFRAFFTKSPVKRTGHTRFLRNILIAIGNSGDRDLLPIVKPFANNNSSLIADAANWALGHLLKLDRQNKQSLNFKSLVGMKPKGPEK